MHVVPCTVKAARRQVKLWHRHLPDVQGGLFATKVVDANGICVGVAIAGNPPREWMGKGKLVISRVAVVDGLPRVIDSDGDDHAAPVCTKLYASICRAAKALGYEEAWTYTLPEESGVSLFAAGFKDMGMTDGGEWNRLARKRRPAVRPEPKRRWRRVLSSKVDLGVFS